MAMKRIVEIIFSNHSACFNNALVLPVIKNNGYASLTVMH
jgi:hypothetical protein